MATIALSAAGNALGSYAAGSAGLAAGSFFNTAVASLGGLAGSVAGGFIDRAIFGSGSESVVGPRLDDLNVQTSTYGKTIPICFGRVRLAGNVIWSNGITEIENTSSEGGKGGSSQVSINYTYICSLAIAICEGTVDEIVRVWADTKILTEEILNSADNKYNIYYGSESQTADPIMQSYLGSDNVPAYRGLCYVVIKDFPLTEFGNRIPNFTFEIIKSEKKENSVENKVKQLVIIPSSGEYVYDTEPVKVKNGKSLSGGGFTNGSSSYYANMHNFDNEADCIKSIDNMLTVFPNLEKVSLVVSWFSTSKFLASSSIIPKAESNGEDKQYSKAWYVGSVNRSNAQIVKTTESGALNYGGTPSDESVINICQELVNRGLEVMFYPFLSIDTLGNEGGGEEAKVWRGRMTPASSSELNTWMTKSDGYNAFITHYAGLQVNGVYLKNLVSKFVIGSEMRGITQYSSSTGVYPGVTQFKSLAATVKSIVGSGVEVGYAADWSEYHSVNGWFNMDPLWTDSNIDFIGIDYYMPLTPDLPQKSINIDLVKQYIEDGEGWEYYYEDSENRTGKTDYSPSDGSSIYAWKNIESWWKASTHTNPNSSNNWSSKAKKIIFTEFGFPSVDGCANQPNVFVDPNSVESFYPRESRRRVNFKAQSDAIQAMVEFWSDKNAESGNTNLVPEMYLWTWDARPYPFFPDLVDVWGDCQNWKSGHWVNGKLGGSNLGAIISNLLKKVGFEESDYDVSELNDLVEGYVNTSIITVRSWLQQLSSAYFFDMVECDGVLKFVKRGSSPVVTLTQDDIIPVKNGNSEVFVNIERIQELELPREVSVSVLDRTKAYEINTQSTIRQITNAIDKEMVNLPIVMGAQEAKIISDTRMFSYWISRNSFQFILSNSYIYLSPGDVVSLEINSVTHTVRLTSVSISKIGVLNCSGVSDDASVYDFYRNSGNSISNSDSGYSISESTAVYLDLPILPGENDVTGGILRIAVSPENFDTWSGTSIFKSDDGGESGGNNWSSIGNITRYGIIGSNTSALAPGVCGIWDVENAVDVFISRGESNISSASELSVLNGANSFVIGDEVVQFRTATILNSNPKTVRLSNLLRGRLGTEFAAETAHPIGSDIVFLSGYLGKFSISQANFKLTRHYKAVSSGLILANTNETGFIYNGVRYYCYSVANLIAQKSSNDWVISWVRRTRYNGELLDGVGTVPINESSESYEIDIMNGTSVIATYQSSTPTYTYTSSQQILDFGSNQSTIKVRVYQISSVVGRGRVNEKTFS